MVDDLLDTFANHNGFTCVHNLNRKRKNPKRTSHLLYVNFSFTKRQKRMIYTLLDHAYKDLVTLEVNNYKFSLHNGHPKHN